MNYWIKWLWYYDYLIIFQNCCCFSIYHSIHCMIYISWVIRSSVPDLCAVSPSSILFLCVFMDLCTILLVNIILYCNPHLLFLDPKTRLISHFLRHWKYLDIVRIILYTRTTFIKMWVVRKCFFRCIYF